MNLLRTALEDAQRENAALRARVEEAERKESAAQALVQAMAALRGPLGAVAPCDDPHSWLRAPATISTPYAV